MLRAINNCFVFLCVALRYAIPPWRWGEAWREIQYQHALDVHKALWEMKKQGIIREENGRYYHN